LPGPEQPPDDRPETTDPPARTPPGEFVSPELRTDCARFIEDVKSLVDRRKNPPSRGTPGKVERGQ
jgi:hypothetical protein